MKGDIQETCENETMTSPDPRIETREERNRQQSKRIWVKLNGKTRPMDVSTGRRKEVEKEAREMLKIGNAEVYLINFGRKMLWEDVAEVEEEETVEVIAAMRRGGKKKKKKKKKKNPWVSDSEGRSEEASTESSGEPAGRAGAEENEAESVEAGDIATAAESRGRAAAETETERNKAGRIELKGSTVETARVEETGSEEVSAGEVCREALDRYLVKANEEGGLMSEFVENGP